MTLGHPFDVSELCCGQFLSFFKINTSKNFFLYFQKQLMTNVDRSNCFRKDIRLYNNETSFCTAYSGSQMDRGHMAPSGDFCYYSCITNMFNILNYFNLYCTKLKHLSDLPYQPVFNELLITF